MRTDILIIGAGASGLMAAYQAAKTLVQRGSSESVTLLEKMPRVARKIMITGKGRCNFTNLKDWNEFSAHIRSNPNTVKSAFYTLPPSAVIDFFEEFGMKTVVERGDRAFPASHYASDVVDTLVNACHSVGVKIINEFEVSNISTNTNFTVESTNGEKFIATKLILATGGLSYPTTGSSGDGYEWAKALGHKINATFPSLTALVPRDYKLSTESKSTHIDRSTPLSELGTKLCGTQLKNINLTLEIDSQQTDTEFGDLDFTDGGIEGPVGFQLSRKAVKSIINGSKIAYILDTKPGVSLTELTTRIHELWTSIDKDPRSKNVREKERCRILLGKLMPWELIPAFTQMHPGIMTLERKSRTETKVWVNLNTIAKALKAWRFELAGYVGYERCVVTAGGVSSESVVAKTLESRITPNLYFCGELLDIDADTGGYNLQLAFCTGALAGINAAKSL